MAKARRTHIALFGRVGIVRKKCPECGEYRFVLNGEMACCGVKPPEDVAKEAHREALAMSARRQPPRDAQKDLLRKFGNSCAYCGKPFGIMVWVNSRKRVIKLVWDHIMPWSYAADSTAVNFMPVCSICNGWKGDKIFGTIGEVREYLARKWEIARRMRRMRKEDHVETEMGEVLFDEMPQRALGKTSPQGE